MPSVLSCWSFITGKSGSAAADEPLPYAADGENARCRSGTKRKRTKATTRKNKDETRQTLVG